ncbi:AAA family ATPase [Embleya sp. NPDC055664]
MLSIAIPDFADGGFAPLRFADDRRQAVIAAFAGHGYEVVEVPPVANLTARRIGDLVESALEESTAEDLLVVHVLSHGTSRSRSVQVVGSDGRSTSRSDLNSWMTDASGAGRAEDRSEGDAGGLRVPLTLFLVDVCGAGQATRLDWQNDIDDEQRRAWALAGCQPDQPAFNGWFSEATAAVVRRIAAGDFDVHPSHRFVPLSLVAQAIRRETRRLCRDGYVQLVVGTPVDPAADIDFPFFDNPAYVSGAAMRRHGWESLASDLRRFFEEVDELVDPWHFYQRASGRGPSERIVAGCFRGRERELKSLGEWLDGLESGRLRVVTGSPGSGKSALLGMLVCAAQPLLHDRTEHLWSHRRDEVPSVNPQLAALHLREQGTEAALTSLVRQLGLSGTAVHWTVEAIADALAHRAEPTVVIIDALDEAVDPHQVLGRLVRPLLERDLEDGRPACRMLIATRNWDMFEPLFRTARELGGLVDLDDTPMEELRVALRRYVADLVAAIPEGRDLAHRPARDALALSVAATLTRERPEAGQRWGEFLVAGLFVNRLLDAPFGTDAGLAAVIGSRIPRTLPGILELDLRANQNRWLEPVLGALAFARGQGIPRAMLRVMASVFVVDGAGPTEADEPDEAELTAVLEQVRFYLRRAVDSDGSTLYRLFHQALVDHLRALHGGDGGAVEGRILERLLGSVGTTADGAPYWDEAAPYVLRNGLDHAVACGRVGELLGDVEFLVHADVDSVLAIGDEAGPGDGLMTVYRASVGRHQRVGANDRRMILTVDAARHGRRDLVVRLCRPPGQPPLGWCPRWVTGAPARSLPADVPDRLQDRIEAIACTEVDGRPVAVTGGNSGWIDVWDLGARRRTARAETPSGVVRAVACGWVDGRAVAVTGERTGFLRVWELSGDGMAPAGVLASDVGTVCSIARVAVRDRTVIVACTAEGQVRQWDLASGAEGSAFPGHTGAVWAIAGLPTDEDPLLLTGGYDGTARVWDPTGGTELDGLPRHACGVSAVAAYCTPGRAVTGGSDGRLRLFDLRDRRELACVDCGTDLVSAVASTRVGGEPVVVAGGSDGVLAVWDLARGMRRWDLAGHRGGVRAVACTRLDGRPAAVSAGNDGILRVWDLETGARWAELGSAVPVRPRSRRTGSARVGHWEAVRAVATSSDGSVAVSAGTDRTVRIWDLATGRQHAAFRRDVDCVRAVACARVDGRLTIVSGGSDGSVLAHGAAAGSAGTVLGRHTASVRAVACALIDGRARAVTGGSDGTLRLWDLTARMPEVVVDMPDGADVWAVACGEARGRSVVAASTADAAVRVWDPVERAVCLDLGASAGTVWGLACTTVQGRSVLVTAGFDGVVGVWDLNSGERLGALLGHTNSVDTVACATVHGQPWAVTGSSDGTARVWDLAAAACLGTVALPAPATTVALGSGGELVVGFDWEVAVLERLGDSGAGESG